MSWKTFVLPLVLLCLWGLQEEGAQACSCFPIHPQQLYCQTDIVVIRAKVLGVMPGAQGKGRPTKYDIQHLMVRILVDKNKLVHVRHQSFAFQTFKGVKKLFAAIYTGPNSAACGVTLTTGTEYLLMGKLQSDGTLHVSLCDFHEPWDALSTTKNLLSSYAEGCGCTIKSCFSFPCCMNGLTECLWTDFLPGKMNSHDQAQNFACIKSSNGCCDWYRGAAGSVKQYPASRG
ncbi:metalloproteinase inhibitor 2-like isoform X1 [Festucalex cinctus]